MSTVPASGHDAADAYLAAFPDDGIVERQARLRAVYAWAQRTAPGNGGAGAERMFRALLTLVDEPGKHLVAESLLPTWLGTPDALLAVADRAVDADPNPRHTSPSDA